MNATENKIESILNEYNIKSIACKCNGMTLNQFQTFIVETSKKFEDEILSFKKEDDVILQKYIEQLSRIKKFYGKALNYAMYRNANIQTDLEEKDILEKIYNSLSR